MLTGFGLRISRDQQLRFLVLLVRLMSLSAAIGYAVIGR